MSQRNSTRARKTTAVDKPVFPSDLLDQAHHPRRSTKPSILDEDDESILQKSPRKGLSLQKFYKSIPIGCVVGYLLTIILFSLTCLVAWNLLWELPLARHNDADPRIFSEGRAWAHLIALQDIGPSLVGTRSNVEVSNYIEKQLKQLASEIEILRSKGVESAPGVEYPHLEVDVQRPSGALNFDLVGNVLTNTYTRLHNVIVRVSWPKYMASQQVGLNQKNISVDDVKALLVNSHFDSGISSPGAMDARTCISIMLELVRSLAHSPVALKHPVVFLFNGAEESLQEGSHGFITKHPWRHQISSVLNLDAGGLGGPEILFQVGSGEYAMAYARSAPRPHGSITAQELFDTGLLQGDTDYRIFRDHGDIHGLDLAFFKDGYKYHTSRDDISFLEEGSIQHCGDNTLAYITEICNSDILEKKPTRQQVVFYDFISRFMLIYSKNTSRLIHSIIILTVAYCLNKALPWKQNLYASISIYLSNTSALVCAILLATVMTFSGKVMSWFSNQMVAVYLYMPAMVLGWLLIQMRRAKTKVTLKSKETNHLSVKAIPKPWQLLEYETLHGYLGWSCSILLVWTLFGIDSSYFFLWSTTCGLLAVTLTRLYTKSLETAMENDEPMVPWIAYLCYIPSIMLNAHILYEVMALAFPLSGRLPPDIPVEIVLIGIFTLVSLNLISPMLPLIHRFNNYKLTLKVLLGLLAIGILIGATTFPYTPYRPKRVFLQHAFRTEPFEGHPTYDDPAVVFALCDAGPVGDLVDKLVQLDTRGTSPHRDVHDWDPVFPFSTFLSGYSLPAPHPHLRPPTTKLIKDEWDEKTSQRTVIIQVDYTGSEWSTMKFKGPLVRWNLTEELPPTSIGGYHIIRHIGEHRLTNWAVELVFADKSPRRIDVTATHFVATPFIEQVISELPDWVAPTILTSAMSHIMI